MVISPNRYAGVSFYSPYFNNATYLTYTFRYSPSNSLLVGYPAPFPNTNILSVDSLVIEFTQPSKDVAFLWGNQFGYYTSGQIYVYEGNNQLVATVPVNVGSYWTNISLNQFSQRIRKLVLVRPPVSDTAYGHIYIDNFQFSPVTTVSPIGYLDRVSTTGSVGAFGWSLDPDNPSASNSVECYVDGLIGQGRNIGRVPANNPSPDVPYPGSHRFAMPIPQDLRDGIPHTMNCYGIDLTGDPPSQLTGSPKTFKFNTPIGNFDSVSADGDAIGWSLDPDIPTQSNTVHFYIDGPAGAVPIAGITTADIPRPDVNQVTGYPGNHGFNFSIPAQYRDGNPHTIYAYGIDLTGDLNKPLGDPKTFNINPSVQSVVFESITNETINNELTNSELDRPAYGFPSQRIFPDRKFPTDEVNHKRVRVKAVVGKPNVTVYFKNYDVDDPSNDSIIDDNGIAGDDNHMGRTIGGVYPFFARGLLSSASAQTNANGEAIVYFTVASNAGDNFRVAASTNEQYLNGVVVDGTALKDSAGVSLFAAPEAKQTELLTVWRKVHLEVDSMAQVAGNVANGRFETGTSIEVGQELRWINLCEGNIGCLAEGQYRGAQGMIGGRLSIGFGYSSLQVLDNTDTSVLVRSESGIVKIRGRATFNLFDDDDYNSNDGLVFRGDDGEDVDSRYNYTMGYCENNETLSSLCSTSDVERNPYAAAYIEPEYNWARQQPGMNDTDVPFRIEVYRNRFDPYFNNERMVIDEKRDSGGMESNDFWIGYLLLGYQSSDNFDPPEEGATLGIAPPAGDPLTSAVNSVNSWLEVPVGSIGAIIYLETMRDADMTDGQNLRIKTSPHELGHQFGLRGDEYLPPGQTTWGLMGYTDSYDLDLVPHHIRVLRFRSRSPGE